MLNNLFINYYVDKDAERQKELDLCFIENTKVFDTIVIIITTKDLMRLPKTNNCHIMYVMMEDQPTFSDYFSLTKKFKQEDDLNIIANLDIVFPLDTLKKAALCFTKPKVCLSLTRWEVTQNGVLKFYNRKDSQDCWIFAGDVKGITEIKYGPGKPGCDNAICHKLEESGYTVLNPSRTLKTLHVHKPGLRNYEDENGNNKIIIEKPYKFLIPTE